MEPGLTVALTPPALDRDRFCEVLEVAEDPQGARVRLSGIDSIDAAEAVRDCFVLACRDDIELGALDAPWIELIGRHLFDERFGDLAPSRRSSRRPRTMFGRSKDLTTRCSSP